MLRDVNSFVAIRYVNLGEMFMEQKTRQCLLILIMSSAFVSGALATGTVQAAGCMKGAVVGGVAGHMAGHHAAVGAAGGCMVGHHEASKKAKQQRQDSTQDAPPPRP